MSWTDISAAIKTAFASAYVVNLLSALTGFVAAKAYDALKGRHGPLAGTWYGEILDETGKIVKYDEYRVRHHGERLYVTGRRLYPASQTHRRWDCNACFRDRILSGFFKSLDRSASSVGCLLLKLEPGGKLMTGFYMTIYEDFKESGEYLVHIRRIPYRWRREINNEFAHRGTDATASGFSSHCEVRGRHQTG